MKPIAALLFALAVVGTADAIEYVTLNARSPGGSGEFTVRTLTVAPTSMIEFVAFNSSGLIDLTFADLTTCSFDSSHSPLSMKFTGVTTVQVKSAYGNVSCATIKQTGTRQARESPVPVRYPRSWE